VADVAAPLQPATVPEVLGDAVRRRPDEPALLGDGWLLTFAQLDHEVDRACHVLGGEGIRRGSTVAASCGNSPDIVVAFLAVMRMGARWVGLNRALSEFQRHNLISHSRARVLLADVPFDISTGARGRAPVTLITMSGTAGDAWRDRMAAAPMAPYKAVPVDPLAPAAIAYTSGTSGSPKGVVHSQHNITLPGRFLATTPDFDGEAIGGVCLALTILNVIAVSVLPSIIAQRPCVILPRPDPTLIAQGVERHRITSMSMPPPTLFDMAHRADIAPSSLQTLRHPRTGGAELPEEVRRAYADRFGRDIAATYGLTEAPTIVSLERRGRPHVPGSSGEIVPYLDVRIVGDDGEEVAPGTTGEICVRAAEHGPWGGSYRSMLGYWRRPAATQKTLMDGVLHTGDIGYMVDGLLFPKDRRDNLILRGGASVYPAQVERVIRALSGVADCAVVGLPDPRLGERVAVAVEVNGNTSLRAEDVLDHCRQRLARYEVPESVVFVTALPRNTMNKVVRRAVLELMETMARQGADPTSKVREERADRTGAQ
jgi:acyl-CoA synthetase (AMP-forming)/AMP-acid ligase II